MRHCRRWIRRRADCEYDGHPDVLPKKLLGAAMGAIFFCISMGVAIAPPILDSAKNVTYEKFLNASLPNELQGLADSATMAAIRNQRVLLSDASMTELKARFDKMGPEGQVLFPKTVAAIRNSLEAALRSVSGLERSPCCLLFC